MFARHREVQEGVIERFPDALHLLGADSVGARQAAINAFQQPDGPQLIVCATRAAAQGITLTRASNVCFLELEWTPAIHDQAEDRCHRIGQHDAVTAWYLLAADTIDETMARLIQRKREVIDAVTDGRELPDVGLIEGVVRELREGRPFRHLHAVMLDTGADAELAGGAEKRWRRRARRPTQLTRNARRNCRVTRRGVQRRHANAAAKRCAPDGCRVGIHACAGGVRWFVAAEVEGSRAGEPAYSSPSASACAPTASRISRTRAEAAAESTSRAPASTHAHRPSERLRPCASSCCPAAVRKLRRRVLPRSGGPMRPPNACASMA